MNGPIQQLFETVPDALIVVDGSGAIVAANGHAERLFGYGRGELGGRPIEILMPGSVHERHRRHRDAYMARPQVRPMGDTGQALVGLRRDGREFPVEVALTPLDDPDGLRFLASIRDVSETQRARQALIRARYDAVVARIGQLALEGHDDGAVIGNIARLLSEALDIEQLAVVCLNPDRAGVCVRAAHGFDPALLAILAEAEPLDSPGWAAIAAGRPILAEDLSAPPEGFILPLAVGHRGSAAVIPLLDRDRPMGALVALAASPRRFDHDALHLLGSTANMLAALMQRRQTEEQLAHSQRLDAIGQLTGGIAHDFNNLLTIISGNLQLIQDEAGNTAATGDLVNGALRSVARGAELTAKLLAFARRQRLSPRAIDPATMLQDLETMLRRTLGESIQIRRDCAEDLPPAYADATQLDTALVNLAINARDAMPRGGEITFAAGRMTVGSEAAPVGLAAGDYIVFSVRDTGRGMTPETLARAMEPFFTTKDVGRGSGLGLSMVYGFARQSGGDLRLQSRLGYGTSVELLLPVARSTAVDAPPAPGPSSRGQGQLILVVEDERDVRAVAEAFLRSLGYRTFSASSAAEALRALRDIAAIDLLFSDVVLGEGMDGNDLAMAARALHPALPVLLTSGYNETVGSGEGGFELLRKPYRREQLGAAIYRQLHGGS